MRNKIKYTGLTCRSEILIIPSIIFIGSLFHFNASSICVAIVSTIYIDILSSFRHCIVKTKGHLSKLVILVNY